VSVATVVYPEYTDSLIHHLLTKKISPVVIKYIAVIKQCIFMVKNSMSNNLCYSQPLFTKRFQGKMVKMMPHSMLALVGYTRTDTVINPTQLLPSYFSCMISTLITENDLEEEGSKVQY
jgi:hypothetical protein